MNLNSYFNFRIYCSKDFYSVKELLSSFVQNLGWVIYCDNKYEPFNKDIHQLREQDKSAILFASPTRTIAEDYGDILFRVENNCDKTLSEFDNLPINIRQRFSHYPNSIYIDCSRRIYSFVEGIAGRLMDYLIQQRCESYILSFNGEYLEVVDSAYMTDADKAEYIHNLLVSFLSFARLPELDINSLPTQFRWIVPSMKPDALAALKTAEVLRNSDLDFPDFSCVVIEYCKAVEIQVDDLFMRPLKDLSRNSSKPLVVPNALKRMYNYVFSENVRPFELGSFADLLSLCFYNAAYNHDVLAIKLQNIYRKLPFGQEAQILVDDILFLTREFRNRAAHKSILLKQDMEHCRDFVLGTDQKDGLLNILLKTKF